MLVITHSAANFCTLSKQRLYAHSRSKAFDKVLHEKLLSKLDHHGIKQSSQKPGVLEHFTPVKFFTKTCRFAYFYRCSCRSTGFCDLALQIKKNSHNV
jgi:hypothetical protein